MANERQFALKNQFSRDFSSKTAQVMAPARARPPGAAFSG
jgi:hypothetical protein